MNHDAFRDGFIDKCAQVGIHDDALILELYKLAMCLPKGKTPIQNPDDKEHANKKDFREFQDYQGPGKGTPMPDPESQRMEELPEEVDPDVVDNMARMKLDKESASHTLAARYKMGIPAERERKLWKPAKRGSAPGKKAQAGNRATPQGAGLSLDKKSSFFRF